MGPKIVEKIQLSVNAFYSQFDDAGQLPDSPEVQEPAEQIEELEQALPASIPADQPELEKPATVMPGLPVEGADAGDFETDEGAELPDDFDNMELAGSFTETAEAEAEAAAANEVSSEALGDASREPSIQEKTPATEEIGDEMITSKE